MKSVKKISAYAMGIAVLLLSAAAFTACDNDEFDTNVVGKTYQGSIVMLDKAKTTNVYGQLIYRFLSPTDIEVVSHSIGKVGTTTVYGIAGPDTINYVKNNSTLTIYIENEDGNRYEVDGKYVTYEGRPQPAGLEIWAAGDMEGLMTQQVLPNLDGTQWAIKAATGVTIPPDFVGATLTFADGKLHITTNAGSVSGVAYRTVANAMISSITIGDVPYDNFVLLYYYYNKVATIHSNIGGLGITFTKVA